MCLSFQFWSFSCFNLIDIFWYFLQGWSTCTSSRPSKAVGQRSQGGGGGVQCTSIHEALSLTSFLLSICSAHYMPVPRQNRKRWQRRQEKLQRKKRRPQRRQRGWPARAKRNQDLQMTTMMWNLAPKRYQKKLKNWTQGCCADWWQCYSWACSRRCGIDIWKIERLKDTNICYFNVDLKGQKSFTVKAPGGCGASSIGCILTYPGSFYVYKVITAQEMATLPSAYHAKARSVSSCAQSITYIYLFKKW